MVPVQKLTLVRTRSQVLGIQQMGVLGRLRVPVNKEGDRL